MRGLSLRRVLEEEGEPGLGPYVRSRPCYAQVAKSWAVSGAAGVGREATATPGHEAQGQALGVPFTAL